MKVCQSRPPNILSLCLVTLVMNCRFHLLTSNVEEVSDGAVFPQQMAACAFVPTAVFPTDRTEVQKTVSRLRNRRGTIV